MLEMNGLTVPRMTTPEIGRAPPIAHRPHRGAANVTTPRCKRVALIEIGHTAKRCRIRCRSCCPSEQPSVRCKQAPLVPPSLWYTDGTPQFHFLFSESKRACCASLRTCRASRREAKKCHPDR